MFSISRLAALAGLLLCMGAGIAGDAAAVRNQVWGTYLSPSEQATLAMMLPKEKKTEETGDPTPADAPEPDMAALVAEGRRGFAAVAEELAPALPGLAGEKFSEGDVAGLWFRPEGADGDRVLLYFHGGSFMVGSAATSAAITGFLAREAGITAFSLDYPLTPESPYPAQLENAFAAYRMLLAKGYEPGNIVIGGDSAGGNLALVLLLRLREASMPLPAGAYLISPWTDAALENATHAEKAFIETSLNTELMEMTAEAFLGDRDRRDPLVSPIYADLRGLPPFLVQVGTFEMLLDDSLLLVRNAALADVPARLSVWPGYPHDFQMYGSRLEGSRRALREAAEFLEDVLDGTLLRE